MADGLYQVYIRIVHRSKMAYIKTNKFIHHKQVSANGELKDPVVSEYCARTILKYHHLCNRKDIGLSPWRNGRTRCVRITFAR